MQFAVLYRFRVHSGRDAEFRDAWAEMTRQIQARYQTGGSRLHRTDDGGFAAYAMWPSRAAWEGAQPIDHPCRQQMLDCIAEAQPPFPLAIEIDLLSS